MMKVLSDEELIRSVADGEGEALRELYERHEGRVRGYLRRRLARLEDAEEAAQDVFLKIDRGAVTFNGTRAFGPWLMAITRNVLRDRLRRIRKEREVPLPDADLIAWSPPPRDGDLRELIRELPKHYRAALTLKYVVGLSYRQSAAELGITEKGFETRLLRAKALLRRAIERRREHGLP
jgi:RNA polymerase sigma-70 factor (ECF subfamily)